MVGGENERPGWKRAVDADAPAGKDSRQRRTEVTEEATSDDPIAIEGRREEPHETDDRHGQTNDEEGAAVPEDREKTIEHGERVALLGRTPKSCPGQPTSAVYRKGG